MSQVDSASPTAAAAAARARPRAVRLAETVLALVAGVILLAMMVMTAVDVIGRYVFNAPLGFAYEMTQMGMAAILFAGLPVVTLRGEHVTVGLFETAFVGRAGAVRDLCLALVAAVGTGFIGWRLYLLASRFGSYGDVTSVLRLPLYPIAMAGALCFALTMLAALYLVADAARRLAAGDDS